MSLEQFRILLAILGAVVALGNAYLEGGVMGVIASVPTILGSGAVGALIIKRAGDKSAQQLRRHGIDPTEIK